LILFEKEISITFKVVEFSIFIFLLVIFFFLNNFSFHFPWEMRHYEMKGSGGGGEFKYDTFYTL
jgi:hypothetical protein